MGCFEICIKSSKIKTNKQLSHNICIFHKNIKISDKIKVKSQHYKMLKKIQITKITAINNFYF